MATTEFFKCGASERADSLTAIANNKYLLVFGYETDEDGNGYAWRKYYDHRPTERELRNDISDIVNKETDAKILTGFTWSGKQVYLSTENQNNFKAAYDFARDTQGATLPVKFKLGEDADGVPVYHTFKSFDVLADFVQKATKYVIETLADGWEKKDINYSALLENI